VLKTALATAKKFTRKRPFPFHDPGTTQPAFPCKRARNSQNLYQQARATNGKTSALAEPLCRKRLRQPFQTRAMHKRPFPFQNLYHDKRPFPTNAPKFPKTCPTHLRRNRQNRCRCQPACRKRVRQPCRATAKQNRPLPTKARAETQKRSNQTALTLRHLAKPATRFLTCDTWPENQPTFPHQQIR
jgi:hypothetical protein